jgi:predicted ATPase/class 3 adenylate cyclase/tetratricopeptide (TPR) repeat protein
MTARDLPEGELAFVFTDIEGSTRLFRDLGAKYPHVLARHNVLVRAAAESHGGVEVKNEGDSFFLVFRQPASAVAAAAEMQRALATEQWPEGAAVRIRIGVHVGYAEPVAGDYVALPVHRAARVSDAGHGGQVVLSEATVDALVDSPERFAVRPLGEYRLRNFDDPERLAQLDVPGLSTEHPPLRAMRVARHNVPPQPHAFIGRREERRLVHKLLEEERVVTLVAPGGFGKSRLAAEVGIALADELPDGTTFVALGALTENDLVPAAVVEALGGRAGLGRSGFDALADAVAGRVGLVVLDEAERVTAGAARAVEVLLAACPGSRVLVTSRQPLRVAGERVLPLEGLSLPDTDGDSSVALGSDAVALLLNRLEMNDVAPLTDIVDEAVALCRRLDGLPLAIELAAARVAELGLAGVAESLTSAQEGDPVHSAIAWAYSMLGPSAQRLFRRLRFLNAPTSAETIAEIVSTASLDDIVRADVADLLRVLVERSMLRVSRDEYGALQYSMLETFREFASAQLSAAEATGIDSNLITWVLGRTVEGFFTRLEDGSPATDRTTYLPLFVSAIDAGLRIKHPSTAMMLLEVAPTMTSHGAWSVLDERAAAIVALDDTPTVHAAGLQAYRARAAFMTGDSVRGSALLAEVEATFPSLQDVHVATLETELATDLLRIDPFRASRYAEHALPILEEHEFALPIRIPALHAVGATRMMFGNAAGAKEALGRCLSLAEASNDRSAAANALAALGNAAFTLGDFTEAARLLNDAVERFRTLNAPIQLGPALAMAGHAAALCDRLDEGIAMLEESLALRDRFGDVIGAIYCHVNLGDVYDRAGRRTDAHESFARAFEVAAQAGFVPLQHAAAHGLAVTVSDEGARDGLVVLSAAVARGVGTMGIDAPVTEAAFDRLRARVPDFEAAEAEGKALDDDEFLARATTLVA